MVAARTRAGLVLWVCAALALSGCGPTDIAVGLTPTEAEGLWTAQVDGHELFVELGSDGVLQVEDWPANLRCEEPSADNVGELSWDRPLDFTGSWDLGDGDLSYHATFFFPGTLCSASPAVLFERNASGELEMVVFLSYVDTATSEQIVRLTKD